MLCMLLNTFAPTNAQSWGRTPPVSIFKAHPIDIGFKRPVRLRPACLSRFHPTKGIIFEREMEISPSRGKIWLAQPIQVKYHWLILPCIVRSCIVPTSRNVAYRKIHYFIACRSFNSKLFGSSPICRCLCRNGRSTNLTAILHWATTLWGKWETFVILQRPLAARSFTFCASLVYPRACNLDHSCTVMPLWCNINAKLSHLRGILSSRS